MNSLDKDLILQEIPLFSGLLPQEALIVRERISFVDFKKGEVIYNEGQAPDALYCIALGRVVIFTKDKEGKETILEYLHRGKYFGIISLLTGEPHSVSAKAINDSTLLKIKKDDFDFIINKIPRLAIDLSQTLSRRLKRKDIHQKTIFESLIISVFSSYSQAGKTVYALNLALSLKKETHKSVIILDIAPVGRMHSLPKRLGIGEVKILDLSSPAADNYHQVKDFIFKNKFEIDLACFHYVPDDESSVKRLFGILSLLVNDYHYLVLDLPSIMDRPIFSILNQSDSVHILTSPETVDLKRTYQLTQRLRDEFDFRQEKIKVIINEYKFSKLSHEEQVELLKQKVFATIPKIDLEAQDRLVLDCPDCEYSRAIRRISRDIGESQVGLVLGVGVAYGFCHIGVLKVIEEEKIPIDIIVGSSIGSIIASLWAIGKSSSEILEIAKDFKEPKHIWNLIDFTLPRAGFLKGAKLRKFLKRHFGNKTFYDVKLPLKLIASDVKRKEPRILDKGPLVDAIMASCLMPGVFAPFKFKDEVLFDGGVIYPLPTETLVKLGVKKIIAVNVTPSREDILRQYDKIKQEMAGKPVIIQKKFLSFGQRLRNAFNINILDNIFSSVEILQSEVSQKEALLADIVLHPDTSGLYWLELHRAAEFAKRGEEEARKNLDRIWKMIYE